MANKEEQGMPYPPHGYPYPPHMHPHMYQQPHMHPQMMPPGYYGHPPQHPQHPPQGYYAQPAAMQAPAHGHHHHHEPQQADPMLAQSQAMLEGLMGDQAGLFKDLLHKLGVDDKEFWKGAMIGAAAALVLSNDNIRGNLLSMLGNAGDLLKSGGDKVKSAATSTASNVSGNVNMSKDVLRDTVAAGTAGFKESVARHRQPEEELDAEQLAQALAVAEAAVAEAAAAAEKGNE
ncbi:hypothetical protein [uncultured Ferrimonas sp.]|uniref:hypothetical protein n=1 Tax=uncultured Ferrimonas sp. TaxID=432640 RepID=UPI002615F7DC|nr:hypothetical protein [uncultured Ferrimonas sp.]